jgi:hypothetical protein
MEMIEIFVSSYRDEMLSTCFTKNVLLEKSNIHIQFDRNKEKGLPERNNEFIRWRLMDKTDAWLMFVHDDVALLSSPEDVFKNLPTDRLYGVCGSKKTDGKGEIVGQIRWINLSKYLGRQVSGWETVDTFDPLVTIIHSSLLRKHPRLRFDQNLKYHMHAEELCINAKLNFRINAAVVQYDCFHYSPGYKNDEYHRSVAYVCKKHGIERFINTCEITCLDAVNDNEGLKRS